MKYPTISHQITVTEPHELTLILTYEFQKPYEIRMDFFDHTGKTTWICDRTLFEDGLLEPAGIGDVRIRPFGQCLTTAHIAITLRSPSGIAHILADYDDIARFVTLMQQKFPLDEELVVITDGDIMAITGEKTE